MLLLKNDCIVQEVGRRGLVVAPLDLQMMRDRYQVRAALDALAARLAAQCWAASPERAAHIRRDGERIIEARILSHTHSAAGRLADDAERTSNQDQGRDRANASIARMPVLLIGGCPLKPQVNMGPLQDIPCVDILGPVTRLSRTTRAPEQVLRALDEAMARAAGDLGEPGPVYVEISTDVLRVEIPPALAWSAMVCGS